MFWSQRSVVLVAAVSAVILSDFIAARSSYDGKRQKIPNLFLNHYLNKLLNKSRLLIRINLKFYFYIKGETLGGQKYYNEQDGNYYTNPRQDVGIPFARPPSLLGKVINGM